jgi:hypothetical protein
MSKRVTHTIKHYIDFPDFGEAEVFDEPWDGTPAWAWIKEEEGQRILHVVYCVRDETPPNPQRHNESSGKIILFDGNRESSTDKREGMAAFGLDKEGEPDLELVYGMLQETSDGLKTLNKLGIFQWKKSRFYHKGAPYRDYYPYVSWMGDEEVSKLQKLWEEWVASGKIGNKYALPIRVRDQSYTILTVYDDTYGSYHNGVWVPDDSVLENLGREEGEEESEFRKRLLKYAKGCVQEYEDWINGNAFIVFHATYTERDEEWVVKNDGLGDSLSFLGRDGLSESIKSEFQVPDRAKEMQI